MDSGSAVLDVQNLSKRFDMTQALEDVSVDLKAGEIHALVGENGAGKSTLIKILTGIQQADQGEVLLQGKPVKISNAQEAQSYGIAAIFQEPMVFPDLDVAENIFISHRDRGFFVRWKKIYQDAETILEDLGIQLDVRSPASGLTLAAQQAVEIAKAISLNVKVLIMDEPTASLSSHEVSQLFSVARRLRDEGVAVLFISHRLEEVFEIADRITVFRDGHKISTNPVSEVTRESLIQEMVGREVSKFYKSHEKTVQGKRIGSIKNLTKQPIFSEINFDLHEGEILGFAGLVGSRRTDVGLAIFGVTPADSGSIEIEGKTELIHSPQEAQKLGIAYMTEDRRKLGLAMPMSITENITLASLKKYLGLLGIVESSREEQTAGEFKERLDIKTPSLTHEVGKLSGGNQQKVMFSKWLNTQPKIFILDEPTRGIDVGAKAEVHQMIRELAKQGIAILCISSDLPEVLALSDRILVMREGRQMGILEGASANQESVMALAMGQ
ncbi:MAG TPA: sugar ABC transporter ATP-binding protein [SAR324 cluster bacterium]|nr:sugar ABC transporter ATP-binding protein [SAR324 cluster bacterium]MEE1575524.1 sugar ABC transporter ATP-binding protein [Deltaproteobacteria bacterium]MDP6639000.1 sugar ABC transporter ATP-binding protein [SAR324 cluster bacterium]MDP7332112.1 sugar ABC transporter ATP-binding protein [SAR324 cluster bacterium]MDP7501869.1 sugar ABC transporter ATP-binding protein [SAR324 cluster bacterium]